MISKEYITNKLLCECLKCGYLDIEFLTDLISDIENKKFKIKGKEEFLFYVDKEGEVSNMAFNKLELYGDEKYLEINHLINTIFEIVIDRINEIYDLILNSDDDYRVYTNCLDSHLSILDEDKFKAKLKKENLTNKEIKEIFKIIEPFN